MNGNRVKKGNLGFWFETVCSVHALTSSELQIAHPPIPPQPKDCREAGGLSKSFSYFGIQSEANHHNFCDMVSPQDPTKVA